MLKKLLITSVCIAGTTSAAHGETWRAAPELIYDWSLFFCPASLPDRFWYFTFDGTRLKVTGPEGAMFTATVAENGSFKANVTTSYTKPNSERTDYTAAEMTGNLKAKWVHLQAGECWYKLVPK
jgi:hypothetical protein